MLVTVNHLHNLSRFDRRTVVKRLSNLSPVTEAGEYASEDALRALYAPDALNAQEERARLDKARREMCELKMEEMQGRLLPVDLVQTHWDQMVANARARLLALPSRLAAELHGRNPDGPVIDGVAHKLVREALQELSGNGVPLTVVRTDDDAEDDAE